MTPAEEGSKTLHPESQRMAADSYDYDVVMATPGRPLYRELEPYLGMVADIELLDREVISGVLGAVSEETIVIEEWDSVSHQPNGNPVTIALSRIVRITIP